MTAIGLFGLILLFAPGQLPAQDTQGDSANPINCTTAEGDIRALQGEKAHALDQIAKGVTAIAPAGFVLGMITGTEKKKLEVASGDYNQMIDKRISEIKQQCGIK